MSLQVGHPAPPFDARSDDGRRVNLVALRGQWVVLYFYPKASTPACSMEAQRFEAALPELEQLGATVIGVSTDTEARQASFRDRCNLSFPLVPDGNKRLARDYGVVGGLRGLLGIASRETFLIDPQGRLACHWRDVNPATHAGEVLKELERRTGAC
ncbi:peroxiredoxin [Deinococcus malanensis]|uniref:thioredoxin-dependent peroxiredoxin n=1 Tax=Deinococcus malanensis TaxID=1706855 RepID=A0ABQ2EJJ1_9DEIO|nr:peroxiredoxin [Deinococcus malanensis]GGK14095.1 peroxiredoxin [Deinococcus malanensis]